jgi:hypothetical protein
MEVAKVFLYEYLNAHPEDHEKISEFLNKLRDTVDMTTVLEDYTPPLEVDLTGSCRLCKKTWESTPNAVKSTLLCGHTYHTSCTMIYKYDDGETGCIVDGCNIDEWRVIRNLRNNRVPQADIDVRGQLIRNLLNRADFKTDLQALKKSIAKVRKCKGSFNRFHKKSRAEFIHTHVHDIRAIQKSLNIHYNGLNTCSEAKVLNSSIRKYRRFARDIFTRYHVSLRDLIDKRVIKMKWDLRSILERHGRHINRWRSAVKIQPGMNPWKDPLEDMAPAGLESDVTA